MKKKDKKTPVSENETTNGSYQYPTSATSISGEYYLTTSTPAYVKTTTYDTYNVKKSGKQVLKSRVVKTSSKQMIVNANPSCAFTENDTNNSTSVA